MPLTITAIRRTAIATLVLVVFVSASAQSAPRADLIDSHWTKSGNETLQHDAWDSFLQTHVVSDADGVDRVTYGKVSTANRQLLDDYLTMLQASVVTKLTRDEQFAYWVNLYNVATVAVVLDAYPVDSIRDIGGGLFARGPWDEKVVTVEERRLSLNNIEHGILRPIWQDPRIHYVVNCASIGCPNLGRHAFTADAKEEILTTAARNYVNHPRGVSIADNRLTVSSIYAWYAEDFGGNDAGVIAHLKTFAEPELLMALTAIESIADDVYDWRLNEHQ